MATRTLAVTIVGDSRSLERAFAKSSKSAKGFQKDMSQTFRGTVAGSGAFSGLARSVAFASSAFLGAAGFTAAVRGAFSELNESRKVTAQTNAALASTGRVAGVTAEHIDDLGKSLLRKTGIDDEAIRSTANLLLTFTNLRNVAGEGNNVFDQATQATLDMSTAMGGDLQGAAVRVGKALQDPIKGATALRRVGVQLTEAQQAQIKALTKTGDVMGAQKIILRELAREFGGSAAAAGRVQPWNLLRETIRNISADLVSSLIPAITRITDRTQKWLDNADNVQKLKDGFAGFTNTLSGIAGTVDRIAQSFGGWKDALTLLVGAWVGFKVAGVASAIAVQTANVIAAGVTASAWRAALIATGWGAFAVAAGAAAAYVITHWEKVKTFFERLWIWLKASAIQTALDIVEPFSHLPDKLGGWAREAKAEMKRNLEGLEVDFANAGTKAGDAFGAALLDAMRRQGRENLGEGPGMSLGPVGLGGGAVAPGGDGGGGGRKGVTAAQRNAWFDAMIGRKENRAEAIRAVSGQITALQKVGDLLRARLAVTKDITRRLKLEDELFKLQQTIADKRETLAKEFLDGLQFGVDKALVTKSLADDLSAYQALRAGLISQLKSQRDNLDLQRELLEVEEKIKETRKQQRDARQFRALGLTSKGEDAVPQIANLRKQLGQLTTNVKGTFLDTSKTSSLMARIKKVLSGGFGDVSRDVRSKVADMLDDIRQQLKNFDGYKRTIARQAFDPNKLLAGLGLSPAELKAVRGRISRVGPDGRVAGRGTGAFGMVQPVGGGKFQADFNLYIDGQQVEAAVTRRNNARKRRNPPQKRGPTVAY